MPGEENVGFVSNKIKESKQDMPGEENVGFVSNKIKESKNVLLPGQILFRPFDFIAHKHF
jgi:hypothetical protein